MGETLSLRKPASTGALCGASSRINDGFRHGALRGIPGNAKNPWPLAFSFGRALQQPALEIWSGQDANVAAAQLALCHRARCNRAARRGEYTAAMEAP